MLGLMGSKELYYVYGDSDADLTQILNRAQQTYCSRPGFFKPYNKPSELLGGIIAPLVYPFAASVVVVFTAYSLVLAALAGMASLVVYGLSLAAQNNEWTERACSWSKNCGKFIWANFQLNLVITGIVGVISVLHNIVQLATRLISTLVHLSTVKFDLTPSFIETYNADKSSTAELFTEPAHATIMP